MSKKEPCSFGVFTLVSYVPEPIGRLIEELRESIPGNGFAQPHITVVPPRPLQVPLEAASEFATPILSQFSTFEVLLGNVRCFRETNLLYLDLSRGEDEIHSMHEALNRDVLAHSERFEFRPHLTIGGPLEDHAVNVFEQTVREAWLSRSGMRKFEIVEINALWCDPSKTCPEWTRVWTHRLSPNGRTS